MPVVPGIGPLKVAAGSRYEFITSINGEPEEGWRVAFNTLPEPGPTCRNTDLAQVLVRADCPGRSQRPREDSNLRRTV